ncbi:MAG TPA: protein translocase subunit SecD [Streptosporangiaceae bacterium]|nr:protein translocase subunit SecD [Streptosporangiaceae bacterium]
MAPPSSNASRPGRALAVLAALIVVLVLAILGSDIASPASWSKNFRVHLGLDLTSGTTVELRAVKPGGRPPTAADMQQAIQIMENRVNASGTTEAQVQQQGSDIINVSVPGQGAQQVVNLVSQTAELQFRQVLLAAPNSAAAAAPAPASPTPAPSVSPSAAGSAIPSASATPSASAQAAGSAGRSGGPQELARRARALLAASPSPSASGAASPAASAGATPSPAPTSATTTWQQAEGDPSLISAPVKAQFNKLNCADKDWKQAVGYSNEQWNVRGIQTVSCGLIGSTMYKFALDKAYVVGKDIASASATPSTTSTSWDVNLNFKGNGTKQFGDLTTRMYDKYTGSQAPPNWLGVVLDGVVVSAPYVQTPTTNGSTLISGSFSQTDATTLANQLSYGALPLTFAQESVQSISPQLGRDQLDAGLIAAALGLLLVVIYLLLYYRGLAIVAVCSLVIAGLIAYLSVVVLGKYQGFALSLAGIAGLIVAIGITADSFVVFFERLRDEVREGRSLRAAVERGWGRARRTILVSDTVSFLAAALLYYFAIGSVRGFAFTLGLTTIIDVIVVFTFTHPVMTLLARTKFFGGGHPMSGLDPARLGARAPWRGTPRRTAAPVPARQTPAKEA